MQHWHYEESSCSGPNCCRYYGPPAAKVIIGRPETHIRRALRNANHRKESLPKRNQCWPIRNSRKPLSTTQSERFPKVKVNGTGSLPVEMHTGCDSFGATLAVCNMNQSNVRRSANNVMRAVEGIILLVSVGSQEAGQFGVTLTLLLWGQTRLILQLQTLITSTF